MNAQERALAQTLPVCDRKPQRGELIEMLDGTLFVAAGFSEDGHATSQIVGGFIAGFVLNTLDFEALDRRGAQFSGGRYRIRSGANTMDLYLVAAEPMAGYQAGDTLRENLFLPSTYVRNVRVDLSGVSYAQGPLFGLISGNIGWSGTTPRVRLDVSRLKLSVVSSGNWYFRWGSTEIDTLVVRQTTVPLDLASLKADFAAGRIGFSYDSTIYASGKRRFRQVIDTSMFWMSPLDEQGTRWSWEGLYRNRVTKSLRSGDSLDLVMTGSVSSVDGNGSTLYCNADGTGLIGTMVQDTSLMWGYFKTVWGDSIVYGLVPAQK